MLDPDNQTHELAPQNATGSAKRAPAASKAPANTNTPPANTNTPPANTNTPPAEKKATEDKMSAAEWTRFWQNTEKMHYRTKEVYEAAGSAEELNNMSRADVATFYKILKDNVTIKDHTESGEKVNAE
jgi:hypothetical protein